LQVIKKDNNFHQLVSYAQEEPAMEIQQREIELYNFARSGIMDKMSDGTSIAPGIRMMSRAPYFCDKCIDKTIERRRQPSPPLPSSHPHQTFWPVLVA
jgi:hypothetical protein